MIVGYFAVPLLLSGHEVYLLDDAQLYLWFVPLSCIALIIMGATSGALRFTSWNFQRVLVSGLYVLAIIGFYAVGIFTVRSFLVASLLANLATLLVGLVLLIRKEGFGSFSWQIASLILRFSLPVHVASMISLLSQRLDQMLISIYLPAESLGFYVVAGSIVAMVNLTAGTLSLFSFPKIANQPTSAGKAALLGRYFRVTFALGLAATVFVFLISPWLVSIQLRVHRHAYRSRRKSRSAATNVRHCGCGLVGRPVTMDILSPSAWDGRH